MDPIYFMLSIYVVLTLQYVEFGTLSTSVIGKEPIPRVFSTIRQRMTGIPGVVNSILL